MSSNDEKEERIRVIRESTFTWIHNDDLEAHGPVVGAYGIAVYIALGRFANNETQKCWPGIRRLAAMLSLSVNTVQEAIAKLEEAGLVKVKRKRGELNVYTLLSPGGTVSRGDTVPKGTVSPQPPGTRCGDTVVVADVIQNYTNRTTLNNHTPGRGEKNDNDGELDESGYTKTQRLTMAREFLIQDGFSKKRAEALIEKYGHEACILASNSSLKADHVRSKTGFIMSILKESA